MSSESDGFDFLLPLALLVIGLLFGLLWIFPQIATVPWALFRFVESYIWTHVLFFLPDYITKTHQELREFLVGVKWSDIEWFDVFYTERILSYTTTWIYMIPLIRNFWIIHFKQRLYDRLRKTLDFEQMLQQQSSVWRHTRYLIKHNPFNLTRDINDTIFAIRASVYHGLKRMKIIYANREENEVIFDEERAIECFSKQLRYILPNDLNEISNYTHKFMICIFGLRLEGLDNVYSDSEIKGAKRKLFLIKLATKLVEKIPFYAKIPYIKTAHTELIQSRIFYGYGDFKKERYLNSKEFNETMRWSLLGDISYHYNDELDYKYIERHIDHIYPQILKNKYFIEYVSQHAYLETLLRRLLFEGRAIGKMAPNHFNWLKMIDRQLWYALNDEGLPGASIEAVGIYSHFELEKGAKLKSYFPHVNQAIMSLEYPKTVFEFDRIKTPNQHPISELYPDDPNLERYEHEKKLKEDPDYRLKMLIIEGKA